MSKVLALTFDHPDMGSAIGEQGKRELDDFGFGVIGFDSETVVHIYNSFEESASGLSPRNVVGQPLFDVVAPCMNNFMVAQRYEDAAAAATPLDETIDYVLTLRMRPVKVKLRLLATPGAPLRYLLVNRSP